MSPSEILTGALVYLSDRSHWLQGTYHDHAGTSCLVGALHHVAYDGNIMAPAHYELEVSKRYAYRCLEDAIDPGSKFDVDVEAWNDTPNRTHAEILLVIHRAIHLANERGL